MVFLSLARPTRRSEQLALEASAPCVGSTRCCLPASLTHSYWFAVKASTTPASMLALRALRPRALRPVAPATLSTTTARAWALGLPTLRTRRACLKSGGAHVQPASWSAGTKRGFSHFQLGWASVEPSTPVTPGSNGACC